MKQFCNFVKLINIMEIYHITVHQNISSLIVKYNSLNMNVMFNKTNLARKNIINSSLNFINLIDTELLAFFPINFNYTIMSSILLTIISIITFVILVIFLPQKIIPDAITSIIFSNQQT